MLIIVVGTPLEITVMFGKNFINCCTFKAADLEGSFTNGVLNLGNELAYFCPETGKRVYHSEAVYIPPDFSSKKVKHVIKIR